MLCFCLIRKRAIYFFFIYQYQRITQASIKPLGAVYCGNRLWFFEILPQTGNAWKKRPLEPFQELCRFRTSQFFLSKFGPKIGPWKWVSELQAKNKPVRITASKFFQFLSLEIQMMKPKNRNRESTLGPSGGCFFFPFSFISPTQRLLDLSFVYVRSTLTRQAINRSR